MAFPETASHTFKTYAPNVTVDSDDLNQLAEHQKAIVDVFGSWTEMIVDAHSEGAAATAVLGWALRSAVNGYDYIGGPGGLWYKIPARIGAQVSQVRWKAYINNATPGNYPTIGLYRLTFNFGAPTTAPATGSAIASGNASVNSNWNVVTVTPGTPIECLADTSLVAYVAAFTVGDRSAAIEVTYDRMMTPTP